MRKYVGDEEGVRTYRAPDLRKVWVLFAIGQESTNLMVRKRREEQLSCVKKAQQHD
jgi:hypothetical protein